MQKGSGKHAFYPPQSEHLNTERAARNREGELAARQNDWHWVDPESLRFDPELRRLVPLQSQDELQALDRSIGLEGVCDALLIWKGTNTILDGHTRQALAIKHKQKRVPVRRVEIADREAALAYVRNLQRERRNLSREALSYLRGSEYNARKQSWGGVRVRRQAKGQNDPLQSTAQELATKYGVVEKTIKRDGRYARDVDQIVARHGNPELCRELLCADVRLPAGTANRLARLAMPALRKAVAQLLKDKRLPRRETGRRPKRITIPLQPEALARALRKYFNAKELAKVMADLEAAIE